MSKMNELLTEIALTAKEEWDLPEVDPEEIDEKQMRFFSEILECIDILAQTSGYHMKKDYEFNPSGLLDMINQMGEFYEKHPKLNESQLAFQFAKKIGMLDGYKLFKQLEKDGKIGRLSKGDRPRE